MWRPLQYLILWPLLVHCLRWGPEAETCKFKGPWLMDGWEIQLLGIYMASLCYLSLCIHILFSKIWDDVALNFHSLGLIDAWGQVTSGNCPGNTTYQHDWMIFVWCLHLLQHFSFWCRKWDFFSQVVCHIEAKLREVQCHMSITSKWSHGWFQLHPTSKSFITDTHKFTHYCKKT
jgi:hypothetical protein